MDAVCAVQQALSVGPAERGRRRAGDRQLVVLCCRRSRRLVRVQPDTVDRQRPRQVRHRRRASTLDDALCRRRRSLHRGDVPSDNHRLMHIVLFYIMQCAHCGR